MNLTESLLHALVDHGARQIFGIPGDFALPYFRIIEQTGILPLHTLSDRPRVDIAYGGSCTAGKRQDFAQYHAVLAWAADRGLRVAAGTTLILQFGTVDVRAHCVELGLLAAFEAVGAEMLMPACGA